MKSRTRESGVALITAVLIVALAAILAVNVGFKGYLDQRRSATMFGLDQAFEVGIGGEDFAAHYLMDGYKVGADTTPSQNWARPIPPLPVDERGSVEGSLEDMQGRFNLNNLLDPDPANRALYLQQFKYLLRLAEVQQDWANKIVDWIDEDSVTLPDGAEDNVYSAQTPPYRTANMYITRPSELLALAGFNIDNYRKIEPFITALAPGTPINICTAPAEVIESFSFESQDPANVMKKQFLAQQRTGACFPQSATMQRILKTTNEKQHFDKVKTTTSSYFLATIWVTIGTTEFTLYSLLYRNQNGVRTIARSFGTT